MAPSQNAVVRQTSLELFPLAFHLEMLFGRCAGVHLPDAHAVEPEVLLTLLHPDERALCRDIRATKGARLVEWVGGRIASRLVRAGMPCADWPTLSNAKGGPEVAAGVSVSISHTRGLAVALARAGSDCGVGVDVESVETQRLEEELLVEKIMSAAETQSRSNWDTAPVQRLSVKEAVFKAVCALTGQRISLQHISVWCAPNSETEFHVMLSDDAIAAKAVSFRFDGHVLSLAQATSSSVGTSTATAARLGRA